ncbi:MAG TPA: hypothetical protein VIY56_06495 [Vicinamibacterales bacterium]
MAAGFSPRRTLKRGALVAAANWPTVVIQASTDAIVKVVVAVPAVGGIVLAALVIGAEPPALLTLDLRDMVTTVVALLTARPATLAAFLAAVVTAVLGGSLFAFAIKAGSVAVIVASERQGGPVEEPPLSVDAVAAMSAFAIEGFADAVRRFGWRFVRLGCGLLAAYLAMGSAFVAVVFDGTVVVAAAATLVLLLGVTVVNLFYLLAQVALVSEDCGPALACRRVVTVFLRAWLPVARVCGFVLAVVAGATIASILATAALGLVGFVPFVWFAVLPLQFAAWVLRGLVFQYIALGAVAAYASVYRSVTEPLPGDVHAASSVRATPSAP